MASSALVEEPAMANTTGLVDPQRQSIDNSSNPGAIATPPESQTHSSLEKNPPEEETVEHKSDDLTPSTSTEHPAETAEGPRSEKAEEANKGKAVEESDTTLGDKTQQIAEQVVKFGENVRRLGEQISEWEEKLFKMVSGAGDPVSKLRDDKSKLATIPELHEVNWTAFKNKVSGDNQEYAIEVLMGPEKFFYQRRSNEKPQNDGVTVTSPLQPGLAEETRLPSEIATSAHKDMPARIRLNSASIVRILSDIVFEGWTGPVVMLRPYKYLKCFEKDIRKTLETLETKWASAEAEQSEKPPAKSSIRDTSTDDTSTPAKEEVHAEKAEATPPDPVVPKDEEDTPRSDLEPKSTEEAGRPTEAQQPRLPDEEDSEKDKKAEPTIEELTDSVRALKDMRCLVQLIDKYLKPAWDRYDPARQTKISFADLWHIFAPGTIVYAPLGGHADAELQKAAEDEQTSSSGSPAIRRSKERHQSVWKVFHTTGGRPCLSPNVGGSLSVVPKPRITPFSLRCYHLDFDGEKFGPILHDFKITAFQGEKSISSLAIYPLKFAKNVGKITDQLIARGRAFCEYTNHQHKYYVGTSLIHEPSGDRMRDEDSRLKFSENVTSQVVVDFGEALQTNPDWAPDFRSRETIEDDGREVVEQYPVSMWKDKEHNTLDEALYERIYEDPRIDIKLMNELLETDPHLKEDLDESSVALTNMSEENLLLLPNRVFAFSFRNRKFLPLKLENLRPIRSQKDGFNSLRLPSGYKRTVQALVKSHFGDKLANQNTEDDYEFDLVRGKGKGLIVLLHGAPGVGKTSTAECVAEANGKPLFPITCGDLGLVAEEVEEKLAAIFHLAERWDCVLLLDEADVFLAERSKTDLKRNSLVSVFLRVLEYYTGILFLTTNRVGAIDPAFKSRIHMHLYYPPLREKQTLGIWQVNLERTLKRKKTLMVDEHEILSYAREHFHASSPQGTHWNGRQIRNAFQTAAALAEYESYETDNQQLGEGAPPRRPSLSRRHFEIVARASLEFDLYMKTTTGDTDAGRAYFNMERADDFKPGLRKEQSSSLQPGYLSQRQAQYQPGPETPSYQQNWQQQDPNMGMNQQQYPQSRPAPPVTPLASGRHTSQSQYMTPGNIYPSPEGSGFNTQQRPMGSPMDGYAQNPGDGSQASSGMGRQGPMQGFGATGTAGLGRTLDPYADDEYE